MRLASAAVGPLVKKLFVTEGPGAGLVDKPVRISGYVSFKGEKRSLTESDVHGLAAKLVRRALRTGERPIAADERQAVIDALALTLRALGDLTITDLDAVNLGPQTFARALREAAGRPERHLSADATYFYESLLDTACMHILHFFTQRSTFVAHALVGQSQSVGELIGKVDELIRRTPRPGDADAAFEQGYLSYLAKRHGKLTIYGLDLNNSPRRWPLDVAYLSLEASPRLPRWIDDILRLSHTSHVGDESSALVLGAGDTVLQPTVLPSEPRAVAAALGEQLRRMLAEQPDRLRAEPVSPERARRLLDFHKSPLRLWNTPQPADQALAANRRVLLRGEAGSGKTTLIQWLAVSATRDDLPERYDYLDDRIPFVLPLRSLTRNGKILPTPNAFLPAVGCPLDGTQPDGWENRVLSAGRGLVLIDGIDEIPEPEREQTRNWLRVLIETYHEDNRWLVTSRPSAVHQDWLSEDGFTELALSAMSPADITTFIKRWHLAARTGTDEDAELGAYEAQLLKAVRTEHDLGRLATNPLMCGLICALHRDRRGYLPHGRKDLYEAALSMLLSRRDRERDMTGAELADDPQLDVLQKLAYWLIKNGRTEMDRSRAEDIIARILPAVPEVAALGDASAVFEFFLERSGLLREPAPDAVDFIHRTFQDFLGARAALEEGDFGLLVEHAADDQWEDVIRMAVALARARERVLIFQDLLARGDQSEDERVQARIYLLAAACLEHATSLEPQVREAVERRTAKLIPPESEEEARTLAEAGPLLLRLLPGPEDITDDVTAYNVVVAASHIKSDSALAFLARFVEHPFPLVRGLLLQAWTRFDTAQYAEEVLARLDPAGLTFTIQSDDQLDQLISLKLRPHYLRIRPTVSSKALARYASRHTFESLTVENDTMTDLAWLAGHAELRTLVLGTCPALTDLSALAGLPLEKLAVTIPGTDALDMRPVSEMGRLRSLEINTAFAPSWSMEWLPRQAPLTGLRIEGAGPFDGLRGLRDLSRLEQLRLSPQATPASAADWEEIHALGRLFELDVTASSLEALDEGTVLGNVGHLCLESGGDRAIQAAVHRLPTAFPGLQICEIRGDMTAEGDIDVTPLAALAQLRHLIIAIDSGRLRGADALPESVEPYYGR